MVHFVGAGPGAPDLLTLRGAGLLRQAGCVIYAGSLVNPALLALAPDGCRIYNSAEMTLEQVLDAISAAEADGLDTVRLHTGDPCVYGAVREQMDALDARGIEWDDTPGVSSFCAAAAALGAEYTLPGVSQSVIITRLAGRTPVPEQESLAALASHGASMVIFLSAGMLDRVQAELLAGGAYAPSTPAALVYKASWPEERLSSFMIRPPGTALALLLIIFDAAGPGTLPDDRLSSVQPANAVQRTIMTVIKLRFLLDITLSV